MDKRFALIVLVLSTLLIAGAYASAFLPGGPPPWAAYAMALGTAAIMVGLMTLGAVRREGLGRLRLPFMVTFLIIIVAFGAALTLPSVDPGNPSLWLGLPPRTAIVLLGVGLLPLLFLPLSYALTFEEMTLSEADLARVRDAARALAPTPDVARSADASANPETER